MYIGIGLQNTKPAAPIQVHFLLLERICFFVNAHDVAGCVAHIVRGCATRAFADAIACCIVAVNNNAAVFLMYFSNFPINCPLNVYNILAAVFNKVANFVVEVITVGLTLLYVVVIYAGLL